MKRMPYLRVFGFALALFFISSSLGYGTTLQINQIFVNDQSYSTNFSYSLNIPGSINGFSISGSILLNSGNALVRVILVDKNWNEYLVYEAYPLIVDEMEFSATGGSACGGQISDACEETCALENIEPESLRVQLVDAMIEIDSINYDDSVMPRAAIPALKAFQEEMRAEQNASKIQKINENIQKKGLRWIAGETSVSGLSYEEKKKLFGAGEPSDDLPNLQGFLYYKGGIFESEPAGSEAVSGGNQPKGAAGSSELPDRWDWRDRHGTSWVTSVKNQSGCGSCWAFAATAATELLGNLYFNQHIDLNLSEQYALSCSTNNSGSSCGSCSGGWPNCVLDFYTGAGAIPEECFAYTATDQPCTNKCSSPGDIVKIGGRQTYYRDSADSLKRMIIEQGAVSGGRLSWSHAMNLVGYQPDGTNILWIFKNSWGSGWGDAGYAIMTQEISDFGYTYSLLTPVTSSNGGYTVSCVDNDGDGYYNWGLDYLDKPTNAPPECSEVMDWDDSDPGIGPFATNFFPQYLAVNATCSDGAYTDKVQVAWAVSTNANLGGFKIWRNAVSNSEEAVCIQTNTDSTATNYDDVTPVVEQPYFYWVQLSHSNTPAEYGPACGGDVGYKKAITAPDAPEGVSASDGSYTNKVQVTWTVSEYTMGYEVWRNSVDNTNTATSLGTTEALEYDDITAGYNTNYYYWVKATNSVGTSGFSDPDTGWLGLSLPSGVSASDGTYTNKIRITWNEVTGATGYEVLRNTSDNAEGGTRIAEVQATSYDDTSAEVGTNYYYWLKATNAVGASALSDSDTGWRALAPPTGIGLIPSTNSIQLQAQGDLPDLEPGSAGVLFAETNGFNTGINAWIKATNDTVLNLNPNTEYRFKAKARTSDGLESAYCAVTSCYTLAVVPLEPLATAVGPHSVRLVLDAAVTGGVYNADGNPDYTQYAVGICTNSISTNYINFSGAMTNNAVWGVFTTWGGTNGLIVTNLDNLATNGFMVMARNQDEIETVFSGSTNANFAPFSAIISVAQTNDGSGLLNVDVRINNPRTNECSMRLAYGYSGDGMGQATNSAWLATAVSAGYGTPVVTNEDTFQVTDIAATNMSNTVAFAFDTQSAGNSPSLVNLHTTVWLCVSVYDPTANITGPTEWTSAWIDNQMPACSIDRAGSGPTNASTVSFSILFSEPVSDFAMADIDLLLSGTSGELANFSGTGAGYTVQVVNVTGDGSVGVQVSSNKCADSFGNANAGVVSTNYAIDQTRPECTIARTGASVTREDTVGFTITFTESVTGFTEDDITLHKTGAEGSLSGFSGSGKDYSVNVINITGDGTIGISVGQGNANDIAGNNNQAGAQQEYQIDNTAPSVAISDPSTSLTASGPVTYMVTYSGADSISLATNAVTLNPSPPPSGGYAVASRTGPATSLLRLRSAQVRAGTANGTVSVSGSGTGTRTVTISGITGDGTLGITVAANTAQDTAGNEAGSVTSTCFSVDNTAPSVTITSTTDGTVNTFPIPVSVLFSESVTGFSIGDIEVGNGAAGNFVTVSASSYTFEMTPSSTGSVTADIAENVAHDAMGHGNSAASQFVRTYEISVPASVSASDGGFTDKIRVTWNSVSGATSYEVWRNTSNSAESGTRPSFAKASAGKIAEVSETTHDDISAEIDVTYYYWVKAKNSLGTSELSNSDSGWRRSAASTDNAESDLDGDGLVDVTVYHEESGYWYMFLSASGEVFSQKFGESGYSAVPGDFDGDGKTDLAVYHRESGYWCILPSSTYSLSYQKFGAQGYEPVLGDYDGDGKSDMAVYQEISGFWYILPSATYSLSYQQFGALGYSPVQSDFDGDGKTDIAVYHEDTGEWYIWSFANGLITWAVVWGGSGLTPVPGDYDGDGKSDLAVYHEDTGQWYIWSFANGLITWAVVWGGSGLTPVPGDYDGDGKADLAVYHESSGYWYIFLSESGTISYLQFGGPGYEPVGR